MLYIKRRTILEQAIIDKTERYFHHHQHISKETRGTENKSKHLLALATRFD
jgi:hypothetical protein